MARTYHPSTNVITFTNVADTLTNVMRIYKIVISGAAAGGTVTMLNTEGGLIWEWTFGASGSPASMEVNLNKKVTGIKFTALTGTVVVYGLLEGTPAP